jgi:hypothetical protein
LDRKHNQLGGFHGDGRNLTTFHPSGATHRHCTGLTWCEIIQKKLRAIVALAINLHPTLQDQYGARHKLTRPDDGFVGIIRFNDAIVYERFNQCGFKLRKNLMDAVYVIDFGVWHGHDFFIKGREFRRISRPLRSFMIKTGLFLDLTFNRDTPQGWYLVDELGAEVLLPNKYCPAEAIEGDVINVFIYRDRLNPHKYLRYSFNGVFPKTGIYCNEIPSDENWNNMRRDYNMDLKPWRTTGNHILVCLFLFLIQNHILIYLFLIQNYNKFH